MCPAVKPFILKDYTNVSCYIAVDGGYSSWTSWTACPVTCGSGQITRSRTCTNPAPQYSGADCQGNSDESSYCILGNCPSTWYTVSRTKCSKNSHL